MPLPLVRLTSDFHISRLIMNLVVSLQTYPSALFNFAIAIGVCPPPPSQAIWSRIWRVQGVGCDGHLLDCCTTVCPRNALVATKGRSIRWRCQLLVCHVLRRWNRNVSSFWPEASTVMLMKGSLLLCGIYYVFWMYLPPRCGGYVVRSELIEVCTDGANTHLLLKIPKAQIGQWDRHHDEVGRLRQGNVALVN